VRMIENQVSMIKNQVSMADEEGLWFGRRAQVYRGELRYSSPSLLSADIGGVIPDGQKRLRRGWTLSLCCGSKGYHEPRQ
jgi:hypothetical protein